MYLNTYNASLFQSGNHDNHGGLLLPDHPPEVVDGPGERALGGDVCTASVTESLDSDEEEIDMSCER